MGRLLVHTSKQSVSLADARPASFDVVAFGEIVLPTQYLDIRRIFRRPTFRVRDDVIEMEAGSRSTLLALSLIALPYF